MERYPQNLWKLLESNNFGLKERLEIAIKLTEELKIAHDGRVVHRDLKPTNIMVDAKNELTLVDFGIGNFDRGLEGSCGTPGFNAPEQFSGEDQNKMVDIFSLGKNLILILFEWKIGWNILWSSKEWIQSQKLEHKLAALYNLFEIIRHMTQVVLEMLFQLCLEIIQKRKLFSDEPEKTSRGYRCFGNSKVNCSLSVK